MPQRASCKDQQECLTSVSSKRAPQERQPKVSYKGVRQTENKTVSYRRILRRRCARASQKNMCREVSQERVLFTRARVRHSQRLSRVSRTLVSQESHYSGAGRHFKKASQKSVFKECLTQVGLECLSGVLNQSAPRGSNQNVL